MKFSDAMDKNEQLKVSNNEAESRFEAAVDGKIAVAEYHLEPGIITFTHTEVPKELSGRGIAQTIVRRALDHARSKKLQVVAQCAYVAAFIDRNPEYQDLLSERS